MQAYPGFASTDPEFRSYLPTAWFMAGHQQYRWLWQFDTEVRYTGSWTRLLPAALTYAKNQISKNGGRAEAGPDLVGFLDHWPASRLHPSLHPQAHAVPKQVCLAWALHPPNVASYYR